jgi:hypothetical protein
MRKSRFWSASSAASVYETVRRRKDGSVVEISLTVSAIGTPEGNIIGASKIARDISDRKKSQQLIVRELTHRTQNLFAVFQAIAARAIDESKRSGSASARKKYCVAAARNFAASFSSRMCCAIRRHSSACERRYTASCMTLLQIVVLVAFRPR